MKARTLAILALALLVAAGCRTDPRIAPLERDLRLHEDRIYELEDLVTRYEQELAACQAQTAVPVGPAIVQPAISRPATGPPPTGARSQPSSAPAATQGRPPSGGQGASGGLGVPRVEMPVESTPPGHIPQRLRTRGVTQPPTGADGPRSAPPSERENPAPHRSMWRTGADNRQVARIMLNGLFTGGYDADGRPGDEGIAASIEPRDARGRLVAAAAPVSVVVLDPAEQGAAARVARWDFSADEIAALGQTTQKTEGIHLAMDWPDKPPAHGRLHLFVRYTTDDGRKLEAKQEIDVDVLGRQARRWKAAALPARPAEPPRAAARPARRADPTRRWSPTPQAIQAPFTPAPAAARSTEPPAEPSEPSPPSRKRPAWSPNR